MSRRIEEALDPVLFAQMLEERYVKETKHPSGKLRIYNYTARAQYEGVWNDVTSVCRGLIVDEHGEIVARPFRKFFNLSQHDGPLPDGEVHVTEKMDGSLGILYHLDKTSAVATRGSFTSDQAVHATRVWQERYAAKAELDANLTYLMEIVYPANRIVVDYGGLDDLVLLGAVRTETGASVPLDEARKGWPGPVVEEHPYRSVAEAVSAPSRSGAEGYVLHLVSADVRVKIKHEEYVRLHRLFTGVSERRVWEALSAGDDISAWLEEVPDELYDFVSATSSRMTSEYDRMLEELVRRHEEIIDRLGDGFTRAQYAAEVQVLARELPTARGLFAILDGKSPAKMLWANLRPEEHVPLFSRTPDNE